MLNWRIEDGRPEILSDEDADKINIATRLLAFGSYIINYATRNRRGIPFTDLNAFKPFQNEHLPMSLEKAQRWASQAKHKSDGWMKSLDFIKKHFDTGSNIFLLDKPLNWHFGWALFTLGWQLAESLGDSISMNDLRCCSFEQCKAARSEYNENRCITCPRCEGEVDYQQIPGDYLGETGPFSGLWYCEACSHTGYFPLNAHPDSVWHISKEQRTSAQQIVSIIANHPDPETESRLSISPNGSAELLALILVAVVTERKALLTELKEQNISLADDEIAGRYVDRFSLPGRKGAWQVVVGQSTEKGPHAAQAAVQDFVRSLNPTLVLLVGMCGGLPEHNANEKSVIVARQVLNYEPARIRNGHSIWSPTAYRGSPRITDLANALTARDTLPDINIITNKDYGSGEKLVDDLNSDIRANLLAHSGDLVGFEMEGQGMLHALWELQRNNPTVQASVLKGVSDFGDGQMRSKKEERQTSATRRAVRLGLEILRRY
jgi:nucleoside phosphorylase